MKEWSPTHDHVIVIPNKLDFSPIKRTWWGKGHLSTQHLQEMPASKLRQPKSLSSHNPKNFNNTQETFSALELQACSRYIFSGFELPLQHINTIFCLLYNTSIFTWRMSCASCINNYKKIVTENISQIQLFFSFQRQFHGMKRSEKSHNHPIHHQLLSLNSMGFHSLSVLNAHLTFYEGK